MYIIYGLKPIIICCAIQFVATFVLGMSFFDLPLLLVLGIFVSSMYVSHQVKEGLIRSNKKDTKLWNSLCIASGVVMFIALYYAEFKAQMISGQVDMPDNSTMFDYIIHKLNYVDQLFLIKNLKPIKVPTAGVLNYIIFILQIGVSVFGAVVGCARAHEDFCDDCQKYYQTKILFSATRQDLKNMVRRDQINIDNAETLKTFMAEHPPVKNKSEKKYTGTLKYCADCGKAVLTIKNERFTYCDRHVFMEKSMKIDKSWTKEIIND